MLNFLKKFLVLYVVINYFFAGPLRFLFSFLLKADFLNYSLNIIFVILILIYKRNIVLRLVNKYLLIFVYFFIVVLYSAFFEDIKIIIFFFYVIIPFIFFVLFKEDVLDTVLASQKLIYIIFVISAIGLAYDYYFDFPWKSLSYTIGGKDIDVSRDWTDDSVERVAGFFRASYDAASGMILLLILILYRSKNIIISHILFALTAMCVYITTTKSCLISILLIYCIYVINLLGISYKKTIINWLMFILSFFMIVLPLGIVNNVEVPFLKNDSFKDRIFHTWPEIVKQFETIVQYVFGLGIGDIGLGLETFGNSSRANTGDNMFMYLYGNIGIITVGIFFIVFKRLKKIDNNIFIFTAIYMFSYAITANIVESPINQLAMAVCFALPFAQISSVNNKYVSFETI
jgi:hypothetical protein